MSEEKKEKKNSAEMLMEFLQDIYADLNKEEIDKCVKTAVEKYGSLVETGKKDGLTTEYMFLTVIVIISSDFNDNPLFTKLATDKAAKELGIEKYAKEKKEA